MIEIQSIVTHFALTVEVRTIYRLRFFRLNHARITCKQKCQSHYRDNNSLNCISHFHTPPPNQNFSLPILQLFYNLNFYIKSRDTAESEPFLQKTAQTAFRSLCKNTQSYLLNKNRNSPATQVLFSYMVYQSF